MSDCVPYAIHIATGVALDSIISQAEKYGWHPQLGMQAVAGWCLIRDIGFQVTPMTAPEPKATVKQLLSCIDKSKTFIISVDDHWFTVRHGEVFDKGGTHPRTQVRHVFEVGQLQPGRTLNIQPGAGTYAGNGNALKSQRPFDRKSVDDFARKWLVGSTCHRHLRSVHWASDDHRFVLMKHHGHTEYVDRVRGSTRCGTYYALYDLTKPHPGALGKPCIWRVEGRWLASHWTELSRAVSAAQ
jgi:hypothetical protein